MQLRPCCLVIAALSIGAIAAPAHAEFQPKTELVRCGEESCLQVSGYRDNPLSTVSLNGQAVVAEGQNGWRVRLPIDTVRQISAPRARTIEVSLLNPETSEQTSASARLPIGLLGGITSLSAIEVTAR